MTVQVLIRLPEELGARFKSSIPARQRNKFVADLIEQAIMDYENELSRIAEAVTAEETENVALHSEIQDWHVALNDGLDDKV